MARAESLVERRYTFILKDDRPPPDSASDREKSTLVFECDFELPPDDETDKSDGKIVFMPWDAFNATYRGKVKKDAEPLDLKNIKATRSVVMLYDICTGPYLT